MCCQLNSVDSRHCQLEVQKLRLSRGASCQLIEPPVPSTYKAVIILVKVGSGTDPTEGAALAAALLDALASRALLTLATTHHASLKDMAVSTAPLAMSSCGASCCFSSLVPARLQTLPGND